MCPSPARWPALYDVDEFQRNIDALRRGELGWYERTIIDGRFQGDLIRGDWPRLLIGDDGNADAITHPGGLWAVVGNSCDFDNHPEDPTQIAPVYEVDPARARDLMKYNTTAEFLFPPDGDQHLSVDFMAIQPCSRLAVTAAPLVARLNQRAWALFHACLLRFLARDDGRHDVA